MKTNRSLAFLAVLSLPLATGQTGTDQKVFGPTGPAAKAASSSAASAPAAKKTKPAPPKPQKRLQPKDEAKRMYDRFNGGDMLYAAKLKEAANAGNPWAALQYGYLSHKGRLPGQKAPDYVLAQRAYMKAVKTADSGQTGNHLAAYNLGVLYYRGGGNIKKDPAAALRWFKTAMVGYREFKNSKSASFWPAAAHAAQILTAYGSKADRAEVRSYWAEALKGNEPTVSAAFAKTVYAENPFTAIRHYKQAADRWHVPSMVALARWYANGDKLHQADPVQAAAWLLQAAHYDRSHNRLAQTVLSKLNPAQQKKARETAAQWLRTRGLKPVPFDFSSPLNDDPATIR